MINYKKDDNTLQDIKRIKESIKKDEFMPYYIIYGEEGYLINDLKHSFIDHFNNMSNINLTIFTEDNYNENKIKEKLSQFGFLTERKIIIFENLKLFDAKSKHSIFVDLLDYNNDNNIIIIIEHNQDKVDNKNKANKSNIDKRSKLYKKLSDDSNTMIIECKKLSDDTLIKFVNEKIYKSKKKFENFDDCRYFLELVGTDLYNIKNEIDKIIDYTEDEYVITREDIDNITSSVPEGKIYQMIDMLNNRDYTKALKLYSDLLYNNVSIESILALMRINYLQLYKVKIMISNGNSNIDIMNSLQIKDWQYNKIINTIKSFSEEELIDRIDILSNIDIKLKTGKLDRDIAFNLLLQ